MGSITTPKRELFELYAKHRDRIRDAAGEFMERDYRSDLLVTVLAYVDLKGSIDAANVRRLIEEAADGR